jgi:predicted RNA-binding Zn-ribbon protein involved in translation (DUF1610 family)
MPSCYSCQNEAPERALYCPKCATQIRCKMCRDMLEPYAQACISCGTLIGANQIPETGNDDWKGSDTGFVNIFELRESVNSRSVRLQFSDFAVDRTSDVLGRMIDNGVQLRSTRRHQFVGQDEGKLLTGLQTEQQQLPEIHNGTINENEPVIDAAVENKSGSKQEDSDHPFEEQLRQVFFKDKGHWYLDDLNLKATSQKDAGRRVSLLLLLYAQEIDGLPQIPREEINTTLKDVGLFDPNIVNWISGSPDLREDTSGDQAMIRLRKKGRDEARNILEQMLDPNVKAAWELNDRSRSRGGKANSHDSGSPSKPGRKSANDVEAWKSKWQELNLGIDGHTIVGEASYEDKGIIGLWAISKATDGAVKIVSAGKLTEFIYKAFVVKADARNMERILKAKATGKVLRVPGGFEITPSGMTHAETLVGLKTGTQAETSPPKNASKKRK